MDGARAAAFIDRYNAAWNDHDVDAIVSMHTDDSVFENHMTGDVNIGKEAIGHAITASSPSSRTSASRRAASTSATTSSSRSGRRAERTRAR